MRFAVVVHGPPFTHQASLSAWHFSRAVLAAGHRLQRVFFYHDGVHNASSFARPPQDEPDMAGNWSALAAEHDVELVVCIASALRRGILDEGEAARYRQPAANLASGFSISGLGQLIDAALNADRIVTFAP